MAMGFNHDEAMEALVITENKGIEKALELLFQSDQSVRTKKYVLPHVSCEWMIVLASPPCLAGMVDGIRTLMILPSFYPDRYR